MCGIIGAWRRGDNEETARAVARGTETLAHRGPDDRGLLEIRPDAHDGLLVFGHRRLSIIDLSDAGHQPMLDPETGNWLIYNGEVYNFRELRAELETHGCRFRSDCDTEVILQSYRVWGRDCVGRWRGMFAAAIWDAREQELFLVRDRLGIKPLYYSYREGQFLFASELRGILAMNLLPARPNIAALDSYLNFGAVQDPMTMVEGVRSLPAAHTLVVAGDKIELREYWEMPVEADDEPGGTKLYEEMVASRLEEAVRLRLISDVPLGVFLSGGIDSSALAMMMRRESAEQVQAFTISFPNESADEADHARQTARRLGVEHHRIPLTESEMTASCESSLDAMDQPSVDGINSYFISRAVKNAGLTVALSGLGGDEVFCGYPYFRTVPRLEKFAATWMRLPYTLRAAGGSLFRSSRSDQRAKFGALLRDEYGFTDPYFLARTLFLPRTISKLLEPEAIAGIDYEEWSRHLRPIRERARLLDPVNRISYLELKTYLANTLLRDVDVMSMAHSLEVRVPLLDHQLLEAVMRIPGRDKLSSNLLKPLLVHSLPESLPEHVVRGKKRGFTLPFAKWLPRQLKPTLEETFSQPPAVLQGVVNSGGVQDVWRSFLAGRSTWTRPWSLFVLYRTVERLFKPVAQSDAALPVTRAEAISAPN